MPSFSFADYKKLVTKIVVRELAVQWARNGHKLTNNLIDSIKVDITNQVSSVLIEVYMNDYGSYMDRGVKNTNIPYSGNGGGGGTSLYIEGLKKYAEMRMGLNGDEALRAAFAIATKHKQKGMPLRTNGNGTGWLTKSTDKIIPEVANVTSRWVGSIVDTTLEKIKI